MRAIVNLVHIIGNLEAARMEKTANFVMLATAMLLRGARKKRCHA
jgi:hypothetical protein